MLLYKEIKVSLFPGSNHREIATSGENLILIPLAEPVSLWGNHPHSAGLSGKGHTLLFPEAL